MKANSLSRYSGYTAVAPLETESAQGERGPLLPAGPLLSGPVHTTTGAEGQTVHIHRHAYRQQDPSDPAWTAHGYAHRCSRCRTIGGAHDQYRPALDAAEDHTCPREDAR